MKLFLLLGLAFTLNSNAFAALETYSATVEDGTPKSLKANTNIDSMNPHQDEYLSEEVVQKRVYSPKKVIKKQQETIVEGGSESERFKNLSQEVAELKKKLEELEKPKDESATTAAAALAVEEPTKSKDKKIGFDTVEQEKIDIISQRLKYTNEILKRFGRAYDYKTTTLSELKAILGYLEKKE